ncbi:MAG: succinate CoA transferase [Deltaproteobacteria bacterium]|nr:succinate CoA transferase [Deltaproteobacteria bacterium]
MCDRIRDPALMKRITTAEEVAGWFKPGMTVGSSGFTPAGYPKLVPQALARRIASEGTPFQIDLIAGASVGPELDGALAEVGAIRRRIPYQSDALLRRQINAGLVEYRDIHLSHLSPEIRAGDYGDIDIAVIEAHAITEDGHLIPTTSVGISPTLARVAKRVVVELNTTHPLELEGIHDIWIPRDQPLRDPIPMVKAQNRIGLPWIQLGSDRIDAIVLSDVPDQPSAFHPPTEVETRIAELLLDFVRHEQDRGRLPRGLPWQSGVGGVANAVLQGFLHADYHHLEFYSEVLQDSVLDLVDAGILCFASGCSVTLSAEGTARLHKDIRRYKRHLVLRPMELSNNPELIRRLGVIAVNTAVEADIYGHVNSTHVKGGHILNGIGGSGDFERNAYLSMFVTPSTRAGGRVSSIVPFASHIDHSEHSVKVIVTEQGLADVRGLSPRQVAREVIQKCAHPDYRPMLQDYYDRAVREVGGHEPHLLREAFAMHVRHMETGDMRPRG